MKVLLHYDVGPVLARELAALTAEHLEIESCSETDDERFYDLLPEAEVLWHVLRPVSRADILKARRLRLIQKIGVGVNTIDLTAATQSGVAVCNMPGANSQAVAEMTLLLIFACLRRLPIVDHATRAGRGWDLPVQLQDSYRELAGLTIGLVGYGSIPRILAPSLVALGATVIYTATTAKPDAVGTYLPLPELLRVADVISLHVPLSSTTAGMIDREAFLLMRQGAVIINTARGGLVDQEALVEALRSGRVEAAGLDVFATEPLNPDHPLLAMENVVVTPHVAWLTRTTWRRSIVIAAENCRRLASGDTLLHRVA